MSRHFQHQVDRLKLRLLELANLVEQSVAEAIRAIEERSVDLALDVILADTQIDQMELEIEEECLHVLALYQPVATDLRFVATALTINKDLERIGDHSVNLAEQVMLLAQERPEIDLPDDLVEQGSRVRAMVRDSLAALVENDADLAHSVLAADDKVDEVHRHMYRWIKTTIGSHPRDAGPMIDLLMASRQLERIADHAVNIAEDVIYVVTGDVVRHNHIKQDSRRP